MRKLLIFTTCVCFFFIGNKTATAQDNIIENKHVSSLIKKKKEYNKYNGSGYRIQLYYGDEESAKSYLNKFKDQFPDIYNKLGYAKPYWNVQVGSYRTRLDADRALNKIREKFSGAIIIKK